jgi:hypothetical protein
MKGKTSSIVDLAVISNSSITLRQAPQVNLTVDFTQQFIATGTYYDGSTANIGSPVSWSSDAPAIATIDPTSLATGVAAGKTNLTAAISEVNSPVVVLT